jgi:hypothetical protein
MSFISNRVVAAEFDAALLRDLANEFPDEIFDEYNVSTTAAHRNCLMSALEAAGLQPKVMPRYGCLTPASNKRIADSLRAVNGQNLDGLCLMRHGCGWCRVVMVS